MSLKAELNRKAVRKFISYWEDLIEEFPEARGEAVRTMGEAVKRDLDAQIGRADLEEDARGTVISWQELRLGSLGGYAAITPKADTARPRAGKQHTWKGKAVTQKQVTRWLERGHGVRKPAPGSDRAWNRAGRSGINTVTGLRYVKGRMFYSWTKMKALEHALDAANEALEIFAEEKEV